MGEIILRIKETLKVPVYAPEISPDNLAGKSIPEIEEVMIWEGNRRVKLGEIFDVRGDAGPEPKDLRIRIEGDASKVREIGCGMKDGSIVIEGSAGMYLGYKMAGGSILVEGDAASFLGSRMKGGTIEVKGNAGDLVGAPYRGSTQGMRDGLIIIHGDAGSEVGCWMNGGTIWIHGSAGAFPGIHMKGGAILIGRDCEGRAGAEMTGGKIVILGYIPGVLPSFSISEVRGKTKVAGEKIAGPFYTFLGDNNEEGNGKLFIKIEANPHLKWCERYLVEVE